MINKQQIDDLSNEFVLSDKFKSSDDCKYSVRSFVNWVKNNKGFEPDVMLLAPPKDINKFPGKSEKGDSHILSIIDGYGIDFTAKQFDSNQPLIKITQESEIESEYKKLGGYFTSYPNWFENGKTFIKSKFKDLPQWFHNGFKKDTVNEIQNHFIQYGYHYTTKDSYKRIESEGLRVNQDVNIKVTAHDYWMKPAYGVKPIFMGIEPLKQFGERRPIGSEYDWVLLKVDVKGLDIAADLGILTEYGAHIEEDGFWFKQKPKWLDGSEFTFEDLQGSDTFDLVKVINQTKSFVVLEDIHPDRIEMVDYKGKLSIKRFFGF